MNSILYYSNYCENSKKLLKMVSQTNHSNSMHFVCIDKRTKEPDGKIYITLPTGQKILMPPNVTQVPALLLLNQNYKVIYGDDIYVYLRPQIVHEVAKATQNNMEPVHKGFDTFGGFGGSIVSDQFSFLDSETETRGNGGMRQMHNYVSLDESVGVSHYNLEDNYQSNKIKESEIEAYQRQREEDVKFMPPRIG